MRTADFDFELPEHLIAQHPPAVRGASRLLHVQTAQLHDKQFSDFIQLINAGDVLVVNNTRVIKARLFGQKDSGGKIEALVERVINEHECLAQIRASHSPKAGSHLQFAHQFGVVVVGRVGEFFHLRLLNPQQNILELLEQYGQLPLPPYIEHHADASDEERYQTVYAREAGAVAAPTAGLHFTPEILQQLRDKGVIITEVTLHVGAGTFQPVRVEQIKDHTMHSERYFISSQTVEIITQAKQQGKRVFSVGTTSLRALESAADDNGNLRSGEAETNIFITPGYRFKVVDRLLTNFHLPKSTLLMLVSAFGGTDHLRQAYAHAVKQQYRFFSYGDAMLIERQPQNLS